jgi:hypothetical protein
VFEVVATKYFNVLRVGDVVEGTIEADGSIFVFLPRKGYFDRAAFETVRDGHRLATLRPLTRAARDMIKATRR